MSGTVSRARGSKAFDKRFLSKECSELHQQLLHLCRRFAARAQYIFYGRTRVAFDMGTYVVKVPTCLDGLTDNDWEGSITHIEYNLFKGPNYARTRLISWKDIPIVFMERVQVLNTRELRRIFQPVPEWVYDIDCSQVGLNRKGQLVAYDWGIR